MKKLSKLIVLALSAALLFGTVSCSSGDSDSEEKPATTYTVTFDTDGGTEVEAQTVESGKTATKPADPTKESTETATYTFAGWYKGESSFDFATAITADVTLKAKWTENAITYTVSFDSDGGSTVEAQTVESGKTATKPADPTKESTETATYTFAGWYKGESSFDFATAITADVTLKAKWTEKAIGSISYLTTVVEKITEDSAFTNTLTTTGDGTVTYSSSDETVANVNASTGEVTIVAAGITTITATVADSDSYAYATKTATYTIRVKTPEGFVKVPGKTITGNETWVPESKVFVSGRSLTIADLYVCDHEVTQSEYEKYCKYGSPIPRDPYGLGDNNPAYYVNWYDAVVYCNLRSIDEELTPVYSLGGETDPTKWSEIVRKTIDGVKKYCGPYSTSSAWDYKGESDEDGGIIMNTTADGYRLPTEAEWEYIAREAGNSTTTYSGSNTIGEVAWYKENSNNKGSDDPDYGTHEVKSDKVSGTDSANALGIYDMSGNVNEWCWDWYGSISSSTDAAGAASGSYRVVRGGSWLSDASYCAVSYLRHISPDDHSLILGFRVVRSSSN